MKIQSWMRIILIALLCFHNCNGVRADSLAEVNRDGAVAIDSVQLAESSAINEYQYFDEACRAYENANLATDTGSRSIFYANAIKAVNQVISANSNHGEALLLAAQIYREKGGVSYASNYLKRADEWFYGIYESQPQSISANLDYAVFCFIGSWNKEQDQLKLAQRYADETLRLIDKKNKNSDKKEQKPYLRHKAIAYLIKGDAATCEKLLAEAAENTTSETLNVFDNYGNTAVSNAQHTNANRFYFYLYQETVKKKIWLWPVAEKNVASAFLFYYMMDLNRNFHF